jgi:hypothetical protein
VSAQSICVPHDGLVRDFKFGRDLSQRRATEQTIENASQQIGPSQPIGRVEGLRAEVPTAVLTEIPLNPLWVHIADVEALLLEAPTS